MQHEHTARSIIALWPTIAKLADDLGEKYQTVAAWKSRDSIPNDRWLSLISAAEKNNIKGVTLEALARAHSREAA